MIASGTEVWYTLEEVAAMIGRSVKTIENWRSLGKIVFADLLGVPLIARSTLEQLITKRASCAPDDGKLALRLAGRMGKNRASRRMARNGEEP